MANTYLTRTPSSAGNRRTFTISTWVKRSSIASGSKTIFGIGNSSSSTSDADWFSLAFNGSTNRIRSVQYNTVIFDSNRVFRDTSAWYHIVYAVDTTQATDSNRIKIYINGVQETSFATINYPSQNYQFAVNNTTQHMIGREDGNGTGYFDGSMSYFASVDGTAELPTIFGETDTTTGQWKIKTSITPSVAWGTNGFLILKDGNSVTDQSGQGNNWTVGGGTLTNTLDCPSNVFATLNPLVISELASLSKGNNTITGTSASNNSHSPATLQVGTSGKYYYEVKVTANESGGSEYSADGIVPNAEVIQQGTGAAGFFPKLYFDCQGKVERSSLGTGLSDLTGLTSVGSTGIKMFAIDMDNGAIYIGANGVWLNNGSAVGVPTSGGSKTGAMWSFTPSDYPNIAICSSAYNGSVTNYNFGNGTFGTTAVSSAGTAGSTPGTFEYDVPSGYQPLSTKGLNA